MKKILTGLLSAFLLLGSAYAVDLSFDANFALPLDFTKSSWSETVFGVKTSYVAHNTEIGLGGDIGVQAMFTKQFGLRADLGLFFPQSVSTKTTTTVSNTVTTGSSKTNYSDLYDSFTSFNLFVGPAINISSSKSYNLYVVPGMSFDWRTAKSGDTVTKVTFLGAGAAINAQFKVNKNLYLNANCPVIFQFKAIYSDGTEKDTKGLYVVPSVGLGYHL